VQSFQVETRAFNELRELLCRTPDKRVVMMDPEWAQPKISEAERALFYSLFQKIGAKGVYYDGSCSFRIPIWSVGFAGGGDYKGYSYRPQPEWRGSVIEGNLDQVERDSKQRVFVSRRLDGDWFLYFQHWP
jgi:hypothetical protein